MSTNWLKPSGSGLRRPTDPAKANAMIENPPRYPQIGGLDKASKTATGVNKAGGSNVYAVVKPGKGRSR
jgi:hypothetical protein